MYFKEEVILRSNDLKLHSNVRKVKLKVLYNSTQNSKSLSYKSIKLILSVF